MCTLVVRGLRLHTLKDMKHVTWNFQTPYQAETLEMKWLHLDVLDTPITETWNPSSGI